MAPMLVTFGESLFRSVTARGERLANASQLGFYLGGTELNVAANLQALGVSTKWVSCLPQGLTGELIRDRVNALGVDTSGCKYASGTRVGWYLMEAGAAPRPDVVYHRNASAMAGETEFAFDWPSILSGARVFHTSGIACGISKALTQEISRIADECERLDVHFSYDLNFRRNIWSLEESIARQKSLVPRARILFCSDSDLKLFYGDDYDFKKVFANSKTEILVMSQRSEDQLEYGIEVVTRAGRFTSKRHLVSMIDRVGVGDAAASGFFKVYLTTGDLQVAAETAALCGALKYGITGDMSLVRASEIERILAQPHSGIVR
jgi:2-dehydro-3-deoxygluconokinase